MSSPDETVRFVGATLLLQSPTVSRDPMRLIGLAEALAKDPRKLRQWHRVELVKAVVDVWLQRLPDTDGALRLVDEAISRMENERPSVLSLKGKRLDVLRKGRKDVELEREARQILEDGKSPSDACLAAAYVLSDLAVARKDAKSAGAFLLEAVRRTQSTPPGIARRLVEARADGETLDAAVDALRRQLANLPLTDASTFCSALERTQPEIVDLLNVRGRYDEALGECRVLLLSASPRSYQSAVKLTAATMKRADGNLGRTLAFLAFQRKGVVPSGRNPVLDVPRLTDAIRSEAKRRLSVGSVDYWGSSLAVAARLVWLDEPLEAVREAVRGFGLAPLEERPLQSCADAAVRPVLAATRDPADAKALVDFLLYGVAGRDGTMGTPDDLPSPDTRLAGVLRLGREE